MHASPFGASSDFHFLHVSIRCSRFVKIAVFLWRDRLLRSKLLQLFASCWRSLKQVSAASRTHFNDWKMIAPGTTTFISGFFCSFLLTTVAAHSHNARSDT